MDWMEKGRWEKGKSQHNGKRQWKRMTYYWMKVQRVEEKSKVKKEEKGQRYNSEGNSKTSGENY